MSSQKRGVPAKWIGDLVDRPDDMQLLTSFVGFGSNAKYTCVLEDYGMEATLAFVKANGDEATKEWRKRLNRNRQTAKSIGDASKFTDCGGGDGVNVDTPNGDSDVLVELSEMMKTRSIGGYNKAQGEDENVDDGSVSSIALYMQNFQHEYLQDATTVAVESSSSSSSNVSSTTSSASFVIIPNAIEMDDEIKSSFAHSSTVQSSSREGSLTVSSDIYDNMPGEGEQAKRAETTSSSHVISPAFDALQHEPTNFEQLSAALKELKTRVVEQSARIACLEESNLRLQTEMDYVDQERRTERDHRVKTSYLHDNESAALVTSSVRFVRDLNKFKRAKKSATLLSKMWRGYSATVSFADMHDAALCLQSLVRARKIRCLDLISIGVNAALTIQRAFLRYGERIVAATKIQQRVRANTDLKPLEHRIRTLYRRLKNAEEAATNQAVAHTAEVEALKGRMLAAEKAVLARIRESPEGERLGHELISEIKQGNTLKATTLLHSGASVTVVDKDGETALNLAAEGGHCKMAVNLIKEGAIVNHASKNGTTALLHAADEGRLETVLALIKEGATVNHESNEGDTALFGAACGGHLKIAVALIKEGATVGHANNNGDTALNLAAGGGHLKMVAALIKKGATVNYASKDGNTALMSAAYTGCFETVVALIKEEATIDHADNAGDTALIDAATGGHLEILLALIKEGATVNHANNDGDTALLKAARDGHFKTVVALIKEEATIDHANNDGETALNLAAEGGHLKMVAALIKKGATVNHTSKDGSTALILAAKNGHQETVVALIKRGVNVNHANKLGNTARSLARANGHKQVLKQLDAGKVACQ